MQFKPIERFSYSSIETYRKCPAQFKFRYLDKIHKSDESIEAFLGKRVHESLEFLYNEVLDGKIPFFDYIVDRYNSLWQEKWHNKIGIVYSYNSSEYYRKLGEDCIARYYREYSPFDQQIVGNEILIDFMIDENSKYQIKSIVDRLDHDGNGNWEIHDYKTGKNALTQKKADEDLQLALYQIGLISKEKNVKSVILVWHFLRQGIEIQSMRTEEQLKKISTKIKTRINEINRNILGKSEFPPKKSILCNWCYYWKECPDQNGQNPFIN